MAIGLSSLRECGFGSISSQDANLFVFEKLDRMRERDLFRFLDPRKAVPFGSAAFALPFAFGTVDE